MLQIYEQIKKTCQQRYIIETDNEKDSVIDDNNLSLSLAMLVRSLRKKVNLMTGKKKHSVNILKGEQNDTTLSSSSSSQLRPFLYSTPDGALRATSRRRKHMKSTMESPEKMSTPMTKCGLQEWKGNKLSPHVNTVQNISVDCDTLLPSCDGCVGIDRELSQQRESSLSTAIENGLMEVLINICTSTTVNGQYNKDIYTLEERVEALYTVLYLTHYTRNGRNMSHEGGDGYNKKEEEETEGKEEGRQKREEDNDVYILLLCKIDLLQLTSTACDMLRCVMEHLLRCKEKDINEEDERMLRVFVLMENIISILFGCRNLCHLQLDNFCEGNDDTNPHCYTQSNVNSLFKLLTREEYCSCLYYSGDILLSYTFIITAITENGLWQYLWRDVAIPFLLQSNTQQQEEEEGYMNRTYVEKKEKGKKEAEGEEEEISVHKKRSVSEFYITTQNFCVRLTLKIMSLLLLLSATTEECDLSDILLYPTILEEEEEEEELNIAWLQALSRANKRENYRPLALMEKRLVYTLRLLSGFLVFRRVSFYAANAVHMLLTRLLVLPKTMEVDVYIVFLATFFMTGRFPFSSPPFPTVMNDVRPLKLFENDGNIGENETVATTMVSHVLNCFLHLLSFHLTLQRPELSTCVPEKQKGGAAATSINCELVLPGALLSVMLLLEQQKEGYQQQWGWPSLETMMARHNMYKTCEESSLLQAVLSSGLSRTHQVALLLTSVTTHEAAQSLNTLRLVGPYVTAFSQLVRPNILTPSVLHRKTLDAEMWAETLTIVAQGSAPNAAFATVTRRRKLQTSVSCILTSPVRPMNNNNVLWQNSFKGCRSKQKYESNENDLAAHLLQLCVRTPLWRETSSSGGGGGGGGGGNVKVTSSFNNTSEESLPPMTFGCEPVTINDKSHGGRCSGKNMTNSFLLPLKKPTSSLETFFVNRNELEYFNIVHNLPCASSLQRETMIYVAAVEMSIWEPQRKKEEAEEKLGQWPFNTVIVSCCTLHGDELYLLSQPPRKHALLLRGEQREFSSERQGTNKGPLTREDRRRAAAAQRRFLLSSTNVMTGKNILCSASRLEHVDKITKVEAESTLPSHDNVELKRSHVNREGLPLGMGEICISNGNNKDNDDDCKFSDLDAYVANLKPVQVMDIALQGKDQTIASLRQQLEEFKEQVENLQHRLQETTTQREELANSLAERRVEVQLCHTDIIAPLRREVTLLRHSLSLRNQEIYSVVSICHKLRSENESMAAVIHRICTEVESVTQMSGDNE